MLERVYIVAEIGNTHEGSLGLAKKFIEAAADCGVDAVKMQTHIFDAESLDSAPNPSYFKDETRKQYFDRTGFTQEQWTELLRFTTEECGVDFFTSPFSIEAVQMLERVGMRAYKVASGEVSNIPLLEEMAKTGKKIYLSSGMSSYVEIKLAVDTIQEYHNDLVLLQCTSEYPCPPEAVGLNVLKEFKQRFPGITLGYSDHFIGNAAPLASIMYGAKMIEKHFTLSNRMYGSDAQFATEPSEFKRMVQEIRDLEKILASTIDKDKVAAKMDKMKFVFEKSIVSAKPINKGTVLSYEDLAFKKPGDGIPARDYENVIGKRLNINVNKNHKIKLTDLE